MQFIKPFIVTTILVAMAAELPALSQDVQDTVTATENGAEKDAEKEAIEEAIEEACNPRLYAFEQSVRAALIKYLGPWADCEVKYYEQEEFGLNALIVASWPNVKLTMKYLPPEAASYEVEVTSGTPLSSGWYEKNKRNLVDDFFDMNWSRDEFPGPKSEYYLSPKRGASGQLWLERDTNGNVTWLRFSNAL